MRFGRGRGRGGRLCERMSRAWWWWRRGEECSRGGGLCLRNVEVLLDGRRQRRGESARAHDDQYQGQVAAAGSGRAGSPLDPLGPLCLVHGPHAFANLAHLGILLRRHAPHRALELDDSLGADKLA